MPVKQRAGWKFWSIIAVVLIFEILFDPLSEIIQVAERIQAKVELPLARAKWESKKINHYTFDIRGGFVPACLFGGHVEVDHGVVIRTGRSSDAAPSRGDRDLRELGFSTPNYNPLCDYRNYTIPKLFDIVERWQFSPPLTGIAFDPQYGFISAVGFGSSGGRGWLRPVMSHCCGGFAIRNFRVLDR